MKRETVIRVLAVPWGVAIGYAAAWTLWMMIYGIGSRVIEDWEYYEYASRVHLGGAAGGCLVGIMAGVLTRYSLTVVFGTHLLAGLAATFLPMESWHWGLATYSGWLLGSLTLAVLLFRRRYNQKGANNCLEPVSG